MKTMHFAALGALALTLAALTRPVCAEDAPGDAAKGRRVYEAVGCYTCHGRSGQGGSFNYPAPPLAQITYPVEAFTMIVRSGPNDMPAYSENVLSDHDLADIHAFLRSLAGARPAKDIPLLNP